MRLSEVEVVKMVEDCCASCKHRGRKSEECLDCEEGSKWVRDEDFVEVVSKTERGARI